MAQPVTARFIVVALLCASVSACATNPVSGKRELSLMSEAEEIEYGRQADAEIRQQMGVYDDGDLQRYVSDIGMRLARESHRPHLPWTFTVVDHQAVNAFALPGGYIYITRGILSYLDDEAELAGVLGHEIAHVTARHAAQQSTRSGLGSLGLALLGIFVPATQPFGDVSSVALGVAFLKYGRDDERESDRLGMQYAAQGGWDPTAVPGFLETLARMDALSERGVPNWLSTHPEPAARVVEAAPLAAKLQAQGASDRGRDRYFEQVDGLVVGDNPEDGVARGHHFIHPALRFALEFPEGWEVTNTEEQVVAVEPGQQRFMLLRHVERPTGQSLDEIAARNMRDLGLRGIDGQMLSLTGADAHVATYRGNLDGVGRATVRAAHIRHGRQVYLLAGVAPENEFAMVDRDVDAAIRSYRVLSQREADAVRPNRLDFYTVKAGDTWQSIAARGGSLVVARDLAIMNHFEVNVQPPAGRRIKVVVAQ